MKYIWMAAMALAAIPVGVSANGVDEAALPDSVRTTDVIIYVSDLTDESRAAALDKRIASAVAEVCPQRDVRNLRLQLQARACQREARMNAHQKLAAVKKTHALASR